MPNLQEIKAPKGIVGVFTSPEGKIVATSNAFESEPFPGATIEETHISVATTNLALAVAERFCLRPFINYLDGQDCRRIMDKMCRMAGYSATYIPIGYEEEHHNDHD